MILQIFSVATVLLLGFIFNEIGYMTDSDWIISTQQLCKGISTLPVSVCFVLFILSSSLLTSCSKYYILFAGGER